MNESQNPSLETGREHESDAIPHSAFDVSHILHWTKHFFDYLGGSQEQPPARIPFLASPWWLGVWWGLLIGLILLFCGQTSKFIYIDF